MKNKLETAKKAMFTVISGSRTDEELFAETYFWKIIIFKTAEISFFRLLRASPILWYSDKREYHFLLILTSLWAGFFASSSQLDTYSGLQRKLPQNIILQDSVHSSQV